MSTLIENKRTWRIATLILLAVAMLGPWAYDLIHVPAQYSCDGPNVRLEGDFCGVPISFLMGLGAFFGSLPSILSGDTAIGWDLLALALPLMLLVFIAPMFTNLVLLRHNHQARWQVFNLTAWGLAAIVAGIYLGLSAFRPYASPWGVLLYVVVTLGVLALEMRSLMLSRRAVQG
jgi:hypothetical protein